MTSIDAAQVSLAVFFGLLLASGTAIYALAVHSHLPF